MLDNCFKLGLLQNDGSGKDEESAEDEEICREISERGVFFAMRRLMLNISMNKFTMNKSLKCYII